jgi:hypothetical protein
MLPARFDKLHGMGCSMKQRVDFREIIPRPFDASANE